MPLISITRLRLRSWLYLVPFAFDAYRSNQQVRQAAGNLGVRTLRDETLTFWTATAWATEEDMKRFMLSGAHRVAMPKLLKWCDEAAVVRWTQPDEALPDWLDAYERLQRDGRLSKVLNPSPDHAAFRIRKPKAAVRRNIPVS